MSEIKQSTPDFANRPPLKEHTERPDLEADYAKKGSDFNQKIDECLQELLNKDNAGTDKYMQSLAALQSLADNGYPNAQLKYAQFLSDVGALQSAAFWYGKAQQNKYAGPDLKKEIDSSKPANDKQNPAEDLKEIKRYLKERQNEKDSPDYKKMEHHLEDMANQNVPEAKAAYEEHLNQSDNKQDESIKEVKKENSLFQTLGNNSDPKENIPQMLIERSRLRKKDSFEKEILKRLKTEEQLLGQN